jgi:hypothetical protein
MAKFTNSPLVEYTHISPYRNSPRNQPITKVTWHHTAGVCSLEQFDEIVHRPGRNMSSNYMVDKDARVGLFCPESDRCWCSSSSWNDNRAVVMEISNSKTGGNWPISDKVYKKCIELTVDICKRNGIKKLTYTGDKYGSLTFHRFFAPTGCVPVDTTELLTPNGWVYLHDIKIGDMVATANPKTCELRFDHVENIVPVKTDTVYSVYGMTVTQDHRVLCHCEDTGKPGYEFKDFYDIRNSSYRIPSAGNISNRGLDMTSSEMVFLLEVQKIGQINPDTHTVEFKYIVESNMSYFDTLVKNVKYKYTRVQEDLGPVKYVVDDPRAWMLITEYLNEDKTFNWKWLDMSPTQFSYFVYKITCHENGSWRRKYHSDFKQNINVVQALCAINERGSRYDKTEHILYICEPYRHIDNTYATRVDCDIEVSCVTVPSGAFLMRQNGYTTITGNCPGEYIFSRAQEICDLVNAQLEEKPTPGPTPVTTNVKAGDLVKITSGAVWYGTTTKVPSWVISQNWYVNSVSDTRAVLGKNEKGDSDINSAIDTKYLTVVKEKTTTPVETPTTFKPYVVSLSKGVIIYSITGKTVKSVSKLTVAGMYTIVSETTINNVVYGLLKSGTGWVRIKTVASTTIKVGDYVKVLNALTYDGKSFKVYASKYKVLQIHGDRVVISSDGKNVTAAVNIKNIQKV